MSSNERFFSPEIYNLHVSRILTEASKIASAAALETSQYEQNLEILGAELMPLPPFKHRESFVRDVEKGLFSCYKSMAKLQEELDSEAPVSALDDAASGTFRLWQDHNTLVLHTPYLKNVTNPRIRSQVAYSPILDRLGAAIDRSKFTAKTACHYLLSIYEPCTPKEFIIDADNVNTKACGDTIMQVLEIDDNGSDVWLVVYALVTDDLPEGSYTVVTEQGTRVFNPLELTTLIHDMMGRDDLAKPAP